MENPLRAMVKTMVTNTPTYFHSSKEQPETTTSNQGIAIKKAWWVWVALGPDPSSYNNMLTVWIKVEISIYKELHGKIENDKSKPEIGNNKRTNNAKTHTPFNVTV